MTALLCTRLRRARCFWHGCPKHATQPKTNAAFWRRKTRPQARDPASFSELCRTRSPRHPHAAIPRLCVSALSVREWAIAPLACLKPSAWSKIVQSLSAAL
ncbi:MAG: hypothetical protein EXS43_01445 [Opitutus sp.]|nr:hypothetical protein [Opitutus sp.]